MKILIIGADDVVTNLSATPFLRKLACNDLIKIYMLISTEQQPLFITNPDIRKIFRINAMSCHSRCGSLISRMSLLKTLMTLRQERFDGIISLNSVSTRQYRMWKILSGAMCAGYFQDADFIDYCYKLTGADIPEESERVQSRKASLKLYPDLQSAMLIARRYCISLTADNIGIVINSAVRVGWTSVQWAKLMREFAVQGRVFLISAGDRSVSGRQDKALMAEAELLCSDVMVTMVTTTNTADFIAMISLCSRLVSADRDAAWMAASLRVPVIYPGTHPVRDIPPECQRINHTDSEGVFSTSINSNGFYS